VRRLLDKTPPRSQRLFFSATLDNGIGVLAKRFLHDEVVHEADSATAPPPAMDHHVLHISREMRLPVVVDLASAPGRTVVFTRTKYGAKGLARQLNSNGVPAVELHGNLSQNARTRNLEAFRTGEATTLVATDIAARGIHVDEVALVVHADPPTEHKAYLHRSGRTARAGAAGTVVTLMTEDQVRDVRDLTRAAGIKPTTTRVASVADPILGELAPGERTRPGAFVPNVVQPEVRPAGDRASTRRSRPGSRARKRISAEGTAAPRQGAKPASKPAGATTTTGGGQAQATPKQGQSRNRRRRGGRGRGAASSAS